MSPLTSLNLSVLINKMRILTQMIPKCPKQSKVLGYYALCLIKLWLKASESCPDTIGPKSLLTEQKNFYYRYCSLCLSVWWLVSDVYLKGQHLLQNNEQMILPWDVSSPHLQSLKRLGRLVFWFPELQWSDLVACVPTFPCEMVSCMC